MGTAPGSTGAAEDGTIDLKGFPADIVEEVIVPVPSEIFEVMDKLGQPNWRGEMRAQDNANLSDRYHVALQFGVVVADGFIAVQAQDGQMIQNLGQEVRRLAAKLGLETPVLKHAQSIVENADRGDFQAVRAELDKTQRTVRDEMTRLRDDELAQCVSLGGWLRGTDVVTSLVEKAYSQEKAELLNQPDLVAHFEESITKMRDSVRDSPKMKAISQGLAKVRKAMTPNDGLIPSDAVSDMQKVCSNLVALIAKGKADGAKGGGQ
jgi:hypothetical protein